MAGGCWPWRWPWPGRPGGRTPFWCHWPGGLSQGNAYKVVMAGNYAYVAIDTGGLRIFNVSNPTHPQLVGGLIAGMSIYDVAVSDGYAYMVNNDIGLQVIDVSDPANPQRVGGYDTSGDARGVVVSGNGAYVADGKWGLAVFNLPWVLRPQITSITHAGGTATVYYINTLPGTNYTLEYCTNLSSGVWQPVGTLPAGGTSASQTDPAAGGAQRYYRVYYQP